MNMAQSRQQPRSQREPEVPPDINKATPQPAAPGSTKSGEEPPEKGGAFAAALGARLAEPGPAHHRPSEPADQESDEKPQEGQRAIMALRLIAEMTDADRRAMANAGIALPRILSADFGEPSRFGYRCRHCNNVAFMFVGSTFRDAEGREYDQPVPARPIEVAFCQPEVDDPVSIDRHHPDCQYCSQPVDLMYGRLMSKRIVDVAVFLEARDKAWFEAKRGVHSPGTRPPGAVDTVPADFSRAKGYSEAERDNISALCDDHAIARNFFGSR